jgi:exopolysaccharide biosynthesis protein
VTSKTKLSNVTIKLSMFLIFQIVFAILTMPLLLLFGPFENLKRVYVGSAITTYTHQYLATAFLSQKAIDRIMANEIADLTEIDIPTNGEAVNHFDTSLYTSKVEMFNIDGGSFEGKLLVVHDPRSVVVGYSSQIPTMGETTSSIAKRNKSIAAINAGGFFDPGWAGTGGAPLGFVIHNGRVVHNQIKNDTTKQDTIAFAKNGDMIVGRYSIKQLLEKGVKEGVTFGPPLVVNGRPTIKSGDGGWGIAPRTAIAQRKDGAVMFLVIDGRSIKSFGATLKDVQNIFLKHNAVTAANLDGGSSTTMYFKGKIVNEPSDALGERAVPTVFMISNENDFVMKQENRLNVEENR